MIMDGMQEGVSEYDSEPPSYMMLSSEAPGSVSEVLFIENMAQTGEDALGS